MQYDKTEYTDIHAPLGGITHFPHKLYLKDKKVELKLKKHNTRTDQVKTLS